MDEIPVQRLLLTIVAMQMLEKMRPLQRQTALKVRFLSKKIVHSFVFLYGKPCLQASEQSHLALSVLRIIKRSNANNCFPLLVLKIEI